MRLRAIELPRGQFLLVLDDAEDAISQNTEWTVLGDRLREHLDGCGGLIAFPVKVELP
ncbi:hypothetical protein ACFWPU_00740 [Streptomyces sp. NPDC058471]|uniref:hypothetical protein n=1 Tax=Streptomyces sp. NPDC058471 TaxID=3346516 RepID=UPI0036549624